MNHYVEAAMLQFFHTPLVPAGCNSGGRAVWFAARVMQWRHQTKTQQDGLHLLLAYWPLIENNKHSLNTISLWLTYSNQPPTARHCRMRSHTSCANKQGNTLCRKNMHKTCAHTKSGQLTCEKTMFVREVGPLCGWQKIIASRNVTALLARQGRTHHDTILRNSFPEQWYKRHSCCIWAISPKPKKNMYNIVFNCRSLCYYLRDTEKSSLHTMV